jgi:hypothetical protein
MTFSGEIVSISKLSTTEFVGNSPEVESKEEAGRIKNNIKSKTGADEVAFVNTKANRDGRTIEQSLPVAKIEGDWMVVLELSN